MKINQKAVAVAGAIMATTLTSVSALAAGGDTSPDALRDEIQALQQRLTGLTERLDAAETAAANNDVKIKWEPAPSISSPDGRFEMNIRGRIFVDTAWVNDANDTMNVGATEFRTARLGVEGKAWKDVKYKFEADLAGSEVELKDAYLQWSGPAKFTFGQFKTPNSLQEQTSSRYITLMERASFTDAFSLARMIGVGVGFGGDDWTLNGGLFRGADSVDNEDEGLTLAARVTKGFKFGDTQAHFGASFRHRDIGDDQSNLRYRQRPHQHLSDRFVATSRLGESDNMYAIEAAAVMGPASIQAEWASLKSNLAAPAVGEADPSFNGGYVEASFFMTGESRKYDPKKGSFQRPGVNNPVFDGGSGAWQLAARFDRIDLSDEQVFGGEQNTYVIGVNWYLNRHARLMLNYSHSSIKNAADVSANGDDGVNSVDALGIRAQIDW